LISQAQRRLADHVVAHAGVQGEQRHARQVVGQLGQQLALLAPTDGLRLALKTDGLGNSARARA
jgi:hypothetical protein